MRVFDSSEKTNSRWLIFGIDFKCERKMLTSIFV